MTSIRTLAAGALCVVVGLGPTSSVGSVAASETVPRTHPGDAAADALRWVDEPDLAQSLLVGTATGTSGNHDSKQVRLETTELGPKPAVSPGALSMRCNEIA